MTRSLEVLYVVSKHIIFSNIHLKHLYEKLIKTIIPHIYKQQKILAQKKINYLHTIFMHGQKGIKIVLKFSFLLT